jgi:hypothetical protein
MCFSGLKQIIGDKNVRAASGCGTTHGRCQAVAPDGRTDLGLVL